MSGRTAMGSGHQRGGDGARLDAYSVRDEASVARIARFFGARGPLGRWQKRGAVRVDMGEVHP